VSRDVDDPDLLATGQPQPGEAEVDRHPPLALLLEPVGIDAGQSADQRRLAVIDVPCRSDDAHGLAVRLAEREQQRGADEGQEREERGPQAEHHAPRPTRDAPLVVGVAGLGHFTRVATHSISTLPPRGSPATCTVARAGAWPANASP